MKSLTVILAERPEIAKQVYEKYPVCPGEAQCANEKRDMDRLRWGYAKKLYYGEPEKAAISTGHKQEYKS
jgi:hypothetical protein